jgi:hypothetical protein
MMRQFLISTAILALFGSFARADTQHPITQHPTPEEASQIKQYNQALLCVGLAQLIWQLQKNRTTAAQIKEAGVRVGNYAIELSKNIWSPDKIAGIKAGLTSGNQENVDPMSILIFSQDSNFAQGVIFSKTTMDAVSIVSRKIPDDPTRSDDETNQLRSLAAQQEFETLNCTQVGK